MKIRKRIVSKGSNKATALSRDQSSTYSVLEVLKNFLIKYMPLHYVDSYINVLDFKISNQIELSNILSSLKIGVIFHWL